MLKSKPLYVLIALFSILLHTGDLYAFYPPHPYAQARDYPGYPQHRTPYPPGYYYGYAAYAPAHRPVIRQSPTQSPVTVAKPSQKKPASQADPADKPAKTRVTKTDKKQLFIAKILPYIEGENDRILRSRDWLEQVDQRLQAGQGLTKQQSKQLKDLAQRYQVEGNPLTESDTRQALMTKVDIIPTSLALAQAANESAWGESRFAREANNLFGIWTYDADIGLKPKKRAAGKKHFVRIFDDIGESVRYYMHLLNTHPAYAELRAIREDLRKQDKTLEGHLLSQGLKKYSAKGDLYIELIQQIIAQNAWGDLDRDKSQV